MRKNLTGQFKYIYLLGFKDGAILASAFYLLYLLIKTIWRN